MRSTVRNNKEYERWPKTVSKKNATKERKKKTHVTLTLSYIAVAFGVHNFSVDKYYLGYFATCPKRV